MLKIYAIIVTYNPNLLLLESEYKSLVNQVYGLIYIDNGSTNREKLKDWAKGKEHSLFIWLEENMGVSPAQNIAIRMALQKGATHIINFDQDSVLDNDFVKNLYQAEQRAILDGIKVGLVGPIYKAFGTVEIYPIRSIENDKYIIKPLDSFNDYCQVSTIISSGSLIRKEVIEEIGLLREDWFLGYTDHEYCFRAAQYGYVTIQTKRACMSHQIGDKQIVICGRKIGLYSPFRRYFDCRNTLLIQKEVVFPLLFRRHYLKLIFGKVLVGIIYGPSRIKMMRYCLKGFYDGVRGISGRCTI